jgi:hypothetical protein
MWGTTGLASCLNNQLDEKLSPSVTQTTSSSLISHKNGSGLISADQQRCG